MRLTAFVLAFAALAGRAEAQGTVLVNLKFRDALGVRLDLDTVRTGGGAPLPALERVLRAHGRPTVERLFSSLSPARLQSLEAVAAARARRPLPSLGSWHRLTVARSADVTTLLDQLNALPEVDTAYLAPAAVEPPGASRAATPDFTSQQGYQGSAPDGLDAVFARTQRGGDGTGIKVIDVEYQWFLGHEDLQLDGASLGGVCGPFCGDDHGTAVLGILVGRANGFGVIGGLPAAGLQVISPLESGTGRYNLPGAIATAGASLRAGDVLLVEQQAVGPHGGTFYVPAEWDPAVYDAIRVVTQAGVIVVEAAGNGGENLDDAAFNGRFDRSKFDSDAIIVGAGSQAHARSSFSSYGSRVDLQGWGCCVVTTGYGDLFGSSRVTFYTRAFAGTSSASAMVAAATGAVQGFARASLGSVLAPDDLTALLRTTGTAQTGGTAQPIGPFPNLRAALIRLGAQPQLTALRVGGAGGGTGTVASVPAGIGCAIAAGATSGTCAHDFESGTSVTLTATPAAGSVFTGWSGACGGSGTCQVALTQEKTVTATFELETFTLRVTGAGGGSGAVASQAGLVPAIACTSTAGVVSGGCTGVYPFGTQVTLTATAGPGSAFDGWTGACSGAGTCQVTVSQARSVAARFVLRNFALTVSGAGTGEGTVATAAGIDPALACHLTAGAPSGACTGTYPSGLAVSLTATPAPGSTFTGWSGACTGTGACQVTMDQARTVTAGFDLQAFTLTIAGADAGAGTVSSTPGGIVCTLGAGAGTGVCASAYDFGTEVTLTAAAAEGSTFSGWSGACTGTDPCVVTMSEARTVTAGFALQQVSLTIAGAGDGSGTVAGDPGGLACTVAAGTTPAPCSVDYLPGAVVTLTAAAAEGSAFTGWEGACTGTGPCQVTLSEPVTVTARFQLRHALTLTGAGDGTGTINSDPAGITCAVAAGAVTGACVADYTSGTAVTLTAAPAAGNGFGGWSGGCTGSGTCVVSMTEARGVAAEFTRTMAALVVAGAGTGSGTVAGGTAPGIDCVITGGVAAAVGCRADVAIGGTVTLTAAPAPGSLFAGWAGGGAGCPAEPACTVTVAAETAVSARFIPQPPAGVASGDLLGSPHLTADQKAALDLAGNRNGRFDVGDYLALLDRADAGR